MPGDESLANAWISRSGTKRYMVYTDGPRVGDRAYHPQHQRVWQHVARKRGYGRDARNPGIPLAGGTRVEETQMMLLIGLSS